MLVPKRLLHGVQLPVDRKPFDGRDVRSIRLDGEHRATLHGLSVELNGASAAQRRLASHMRPGEADHFTQNNESGAVVAPHRGMRLPIDRKVNVHGDPLALLKDIKKIGRQERFKVVRIGNAILTP